MFKWSVLGIYIAKAVLIVFNLLFIFVALCKFHFATMDLGILAEYGKEKTARSASAYMVIILVCLFIIVLSLYGIMVTLKGNSKLLYTYIVILSPYLVAQWILIALFVSIQRYGLQIRVKEWLKEDFYSNATGDAKVQHDQMWDKLQTDYECCGFNGFEDYASLGRPVSFSCCQKTLLARTDIATDKESIYRVCVRSEIYNEFGCEYKTIRLLESYDRWVFIVTAIGFWLEAAGMTLALVLANRIKNANVDQNTAKIQENNKTT